MRTFAEFVAVTALALTQTSCFLHKPVPVEPYQRALEAYDKGLAATPPDTDALRQARSEAESALAKDPTDAHARLIRALAQLAIVRSHATALATWQPDGEAATLLKELRAAIRLASKSNANAAWVTSRAYTGLGDFFMLIVTVPISWGQTDLLNRTTPLTSADRLALKTETKNYEIALAGTSKTLEDVKRAIDALKAPDVETTLEEAGEQRRLRIRMQGAELALADAASGAPHLLQTESRFESLLTRRAIAQLASDCYWYAFQSAVEGLKNATGQGADTGALQKSYALDGFLNSRLAVARVENQVGFRPSAWAGLGPLREKVAKGEMPDYAASTPAAELTDPGSHMLAGQIARVGFPADQADALARADRAFREEVAANVLNGEFYGVAGAQLASKAVYLALMNQVAAMNVRYSLRPRRPPYDSIELLLEGTDSLPAAPAHIYSFSIALGDKTVGVNVAQHRPAEDAFAPPGPIVVSAKAKRRVIVHSTMPSTSGRDDGIHLYLGLGTTFTALPGAGAIQVTDGLGNQKYAAYLDAEPTLNGMTRQFEAASTAAGVKEKKGEALAALRGVAADCGRLPHPPERFQCYLRVSNLYGKLASGSEAFLSALRPPMDSSIQAIDDPEARAGALLDELGFDVALFAAAPDSSRALQAENIKKEMQNADDFMSKLEDRGAQARSRLQLLLLRKEFEQLQSPASPSK